MPTAYHLFILPPLSGSRGYLVIEHLLTMSLDK